MEPILHPWVTMPARFYHKKIIFHLFKNALAYYTASIVVVNSKVVGLTPRYDRELQRQSCKYLQRSK
jgi:hypothetical protein